MKSKNGHKKKTALPFWFRWMIGKGMKEDFNYTWQVFAKHTKIWWPENGNERDHYFAVYNKCQKVVWANRKCEEMNLLIAFESRNRCVTKLSGEKAFLYRLAKSQKKIIRTFNLERKRTDHLLECKRIKQRYLTIGKQEARAEQSAQIQFDFAKPIIPE